MVVVHDNVVHVADIVVVIVVVGSDVDDVCVRDNEHVEDGLKTAKVAQQVCRMARKDWAF